MNFIHKELTSHDSYKKEIMSSEKMLQKKWNLSNLNQLFLLKH